MIRGRVSRLTDVQATIVLAQGDEMLASWALARPDLAGLALVDELARMQLAAGRLGWTLRVRDAEPTLCELLDLVGLSGLLA